MKHRVLKTMLVVLLVAGVLCASAMAFLPAHKTVDPPLWALENVNDSLAEEPPEEEPEEALFPEEPVEEDTDTEDVDVILEEPAKEDLPEEDIEAGTQEYDVNEMLGAVAAYQLKTVKNPSVGTQHGEWTVIALARHGSMTAGFRQRYVQNLYSTVLDKKGVLDARNYTEYSRVVLALSALGESPVDVAGYSLLEPLAHMDKVTWQGVNGTAWALLALDARQCEVPKLAEDEKANQTSRERLVDALLAAQLPNGGWKMPGGGKVDMDVTGMAVQALAPYRLQQVSVQAAMDRALECISREQEASGGWADSLESTAQVLIALQTLNIPLEDERFINEGRTALDGLVQYYLPNQGAFCHRVGGSADGMATDQGMLALLSVSRCRAGAHTLYDMTDVPASGEGEREKRERVKGAVRALPADPSIAYKEEVNYLAVQLDSLLPFKNKEAYQNKIIRLRKKIQAKEKQVERLDDDIWDQIDPMNIQLADGDGVDALSARYHAISQEDRGYLKNADMLKEAADTLASLRGRVLPKKLFERHYGKQTKYVYQDPAGYTFSFLGEDITSPQDMNVLVRVGATAPSGWRTSQSSAYWIRLAQQGGLPARMQLNTRVDMVDGVYKLYRYQPGGAKLHSHGDVSVRKGRVSMAIEQGGDYLLMAARSAGGGVGGASVAAVAKTDRAVRKTELSDGKLTVQMFEDMVGQNVNLVYEEEGGQGVAYRLTFNGEEVNRPMDVDPVLEFNGANETYIRRLADGEYQYIRFAHQGDLPGKVMVEVETDMAEGNYLLFAYDDHEMRATVKTEVTVEEGWAVFFVSRGGEYFVAKRARKSSIPELEMQRDEDANTMLAGIEEPAKTERMGTQRQPQTQHEAKGAPVWTLWLALLVAGAGVGVTVGIRMSKRRRDKNESKEK